MPAAISEPTPCKRRASDFSHSVEYSDSLLGVWIVPASEGSSSGERTPMENAVPFFRVQSGLRIGCYKAYDNSEDREHQEKQEADTK